jgi:ADP-ribose pyrophosphatase YjhB (NUDIX family)
MESDITVLVGDTTVIFRAGAIIVFDDDILLCQDPGEAWWFTPGGRVKTGEDSLSAINRELSEELGSGFEVGAAVICSENFFELHGRHYQEVCTYYRAEWAGSKHSATSDVPEIRRWLPVKDLATVDVKPSFLRQYVSKDLSGVIHIIHHDGESLAPR